MRIDGRLAAAAVALALMAAGQARAERFDFVALGDTAYNEGDTPKYAALIEAINKAAPSFSIHVGDTWGAEVCSEADHRQVLATFQTYQQPVVYTPGDNEWTDCRKAPELAAYKRFVKKEATPEDMALLAHAQSFDDMFQLGSYDDALASLATIRKVFFSRPESLGAHPMPVVRQADVSPDFKEMVENARWEKDGVLFVTVSNPGSNSDFTILSEARAAEAARRTRANVAWIKDAFAEAKAKNAKAVVIAMQAAMFDPPTPWTSRDFAMSIRGGSDGPYWWIARAIRDFGGPFGKPVLVINGDDHSFIVDKPWRISGGDSAPPKNDNITRLQVYGAPDLRAVRVSVDTETPWVFSFAPLYPAPAP
ncbi:MAG TPA: hypothetical protein VG939_22150 [Caulobacteraceae bacterium]|nr:hypothetical protein [Caulobacteraceae bacterium]